jgi:hypothetical protein
MFPKAYFKAQQAYVTHALKNKPPSTATIRAKVLWMVDVLTRVNFCYLALNIPFYEAATPGLELFSQRRSNGWISAPTGGSAGEGQHQLLAGLLATAKKFYGEINPSVGTPGPAPFVAQPVTWMAEASKDDWALREKVLSDVVPWLKGGYRLKAKGGKDAGDVKAAKGNDPLTQAVGQWRLWMLLDYANAPKGRYSNWLPSSMGIKVGDTPTLLKYIANVEKENKVSSVSTFAIPNLSAKGKTDAVPLPNFAYVYNDGVAEAFAVRVIGMDYDAEVRAHVNAWYVNSLPRTVALPGGKIVYDSTSLNKNCQTDSCVYQPITYTDFQRVLHNYFENDPDKAIKHWIESNGKAARGLSLLVRGDFPSDKGRVHDPKKTYDQSEIAMVQNALSTTLSMTDKVQNAINDIENTVASIQKTLRDVSAVLAGIEAAAVIAPTVTTAVASVSATATAVTTAATSAVAGVASAVGAAVPALGIAIAIVMFEIMLIEAFTPHATKTFAFRKIQHPFIRSLADDQWSTDPSGATAVVMHKIQNSVLNIEKTSGIDMGFYDGVRFIRPPTPDKFGNPIPNYSALPSWQRLFSPVNNFTIMRAQELMKACGRDIKLTGKYETGFEENLLKTADALDVSRRDVHIGFNSDRSRVTILPGEFLTSMSECGKPKPKPKKKPKPKPKPKVTVVREYPEPAEAESAALSPPAKAVIGTSILGGLLYAIIRFGR